MMKLMTLNMFIPELLKFSEIVMNVLLTLIPFIYCTWGQNTTEGLSDSYNYDNTTIEETLEAGDSSPVTTSTLDTATEDIVPANETSDAENSTRANKVSCSCNNTLEDSPEPRVQLVNGSTYQSLIFGEHNSSITNRSQAAICSVTLFYAPWCDFSAAAAPHYNALARVFPQLRSSHTSLCQSGVIFISCRFYALDSYENHAMNTQFGVMALPSVLLFHNSRPIFKYNFTDYNLASFSQFINILTGVTTPSVN